VNRNSEDFRRQAAELLESERYIGETMEQIKRIEDTSK